VDRPDPARASRSPQGRKDFKSNITILPSSVQAEFRVVYYQSGNPFQEKCGAAKADLFEGIKKAVAADRYD